MAHAKHTTSIEYREISRFPGYRFGSDGSAWTQWSAKLRRNQRAIWTRSETWKLLRVADVQGYLCVRLSYFERKHFKLHRLILEAFSGSCPDGMVCRHLDGNPTNNRPENLAWGTCQQNADDCKRHGNTTRGTRHPNAKLSEEQVCEIVRLADSGMLHEEIARRMGTGRPNISLITNGTTWGYLTGRTRKRIPIVSSQ